ncbi:hypothetical protein ACF1BQ_029565 [Bradyrhizobium sp. RDT10]
MTFPNQSFDLGRCGFVRPGSAAVDIRYHRIASTPIARHAGRPCRSLTTISCRAIASSIVSQEKNGEKSSFDALASVRNPESVE